MKYGCQRFQISSQNCMVNLFDLFFPYVQNIERIEMIIIITDPNASFHTLPSSSKKVHASVIFTIECTSFLAFSNFIPGNDYRLFSRFLMSRWAGNVSYTVRNDRLVDCWNYFIYASKRSIVLKTVQMSVVLSGLNTFILTLFKYKILQFHINKVV